ncbi:MAG: C-type lectin domain-containing protein [Planctomycetes bacterium]|nr:C-type lectin domain-containing protein [Planctomycetota bacterium]
MRGIKRNTLAILVGLATSAAVAQPVQWRVEDGGNGHWYQVVAHGGESAQFFDYSVWQANYEMYYFQRGFLGAEAAYWQVTWNGLDHGYESTHLVHIGTPEENEFVRRLLVSSGATSALIGLHQVRLDETVPPELEPDQNWMWDSGDPVLFTSWGVGQPDDAPPGEQAAVMDAGSGHWSDWGPVTCCEPDAMVIEYTAPVGPSARFVSAYAVNRRWCLRAPNRYDAAGPCFAIGRSEIAVHPGDEVVLFALVGDYQCSLSSADWMRGMQNITSTEWFRNGVSLGVGIVGPRFAGYDACTSYFEGVWVCESNGYTCNTADRSYQFVCSRDSGGTYDLIVSNIFGKSSAFSFTVEVVCRADFNNDGGIDGADLESFFGLWEAGDEAADFNDDDGVDGSDVEVFFRHWESGC